MKVKKIYRGLNSTVISMTNTLLLTYTENNKI